MEKIKYLLIGVKYLKPKKKKKIRNKDKKPKIFYGYNTNK